MPPRSYTDTVDQSQETNEQPRQLDLVEFQALQARLHPILDELSEIPDGDLVHELVDMSLKLLRDRTNRGDMKLLSRTLRELRYALKVFAPYRSVRKISIFGSARTPKEAPDYRLAEDFGRKMAQNGWMVTTGAGGGIMAAGHSGAGPEPSFGLAIRLPFEQRSNDTIERDPKLISFKYFFTRKLMFLRTSHAVALFPGGFGTLDEGFEALTLIQTGKSVPVPIVLMDHVRGDYWDRWLEFVKEALLHRKFIDALDLDLFKIFRDPQAATDEVLRFYSNYHSLRYDRDNLIFRIQVEPTQAQLERISREFRDISREGRFRVSRALPCERDEPELASMPRLVFDFNNRSFARLRQLIDHLNDLV